MTPAVSRRGLLAGACAVCAAVLTGCASTGRGASPAIRLSTSDPLVALDAIPVGEAVSVTVPGGASIIVGRPTADTAAAFSPICTHQGCTVSPAGSRLECPCHGSVFDATTGAVVRGPAARPLQSLPVTVRDGQVFAT